MTPSLTATANLPIPALLAGAVALAGGLSGAAVRQLVRSGLHRRPGDRARTGRGGAVRPGSAQPPRPQPGSPGDPLPEARWLVPGLALGWTGSALALSPRGIGVTLAYLSALTVAAWLVAIDIDVQRLPNAVTLPAIPLSAMALGGCSLLGRDPPAWARGLLGGLALGTGYLLLHALGTRRGRAAIGLGDVKLAASLGQWLAWLGWPVLAAGAYLGLLLSGLCATGLLLARRARRDSTLPHGPSMVLGGWLAGCGASFL
ncbi:MAG: A24 family peptidase [Micrococcales bacterium]|nr:A24 family peptidase [Micrococcales bacterium]